MKMLWTEKYRPNKIGEIVGQEHFVMDATTWIEEGNMPNVLFFGNAGTGKTAAGIALAKGILGDSFKDNFVEVNASDDRRLEVVRTTIKTIAQSGTIGDAPFRIILLDELGGMTIDAQSALKRMAERYSNNVRFIITCNDRSKIIHPLQSRCANYHFKPLNNEVILEVIKSILQKEQVNVFADDELATFIYEVDGDLRRAITEIQAAKSSGFSLSKQIESSHKEYNEILIEILNKNPNKALTDLHKLVYEGRSVKQICLGLHNAIIASAGLDNATKYKLLRTVGESEYRSTTMTPKVLISWMVGQLI
jgi:replication factor C small subunit